MTKKATFPTPAASDFYRFDSSGRLSVCLTPIRCHPPGVSGGAAKTVSDFSPWWIMRTPLFWRDDSGDWLSIRLVRWRMQRYKGWKLPPELAAPIVVLTPIGEEFQAQLDADCPEPATGEELHQGAALLEHIATGGTHPDVFVVQRTHIRHALWYGPLLAKTPMKHKPIWSYVWNPLLEKSEEVDISEHSALGRETLAPGCILGSKESGAKGVAVPLSISQERYAHVF